MMVVRREAAKLPSAPGGFRFDRLCDPPPGGRVL